MVGLILKVRFFIKMDLGSVRSYEVIFGQDLSRVLYIILSVAMSSREECIVSYIQYVIRRK